MKIVLIGKNYVLKEKIPKNISDSYWIKDRKNDVNLIKIKNNLNKIEIESDNNFQIINPKYLELSEEEISVAKNPDCILKKVELKENDIYAVSFGDLEEIFVLFCMPDYEENFYHMDIVNVREFTIGYTKNNDIMYENALVEDTHARVYREDNKWFIENKDKKYGLFVNDFPVFDKPKTVFNGDIIFIMGIKIIIMNKSLYITNPNKNVRINKSLFSPSLIKNTNPDIEYLDEDSEAIVSKKEKYYSRSPRIENHIQKEKIKIDEPPQMQDNGQRPMMLSLASTLIFGITSISSITTVIRDVREGTASTLEIVISLITTIAMMVAMIIIPIIEVNWEKKNSERYEQKRQKKYKEYLNKKKKVVESIKNKQKQILYERDVSAKECIEIISTKNHRLWERTISDPDFLSIRIGIGDVPLQVDITYPEEKFAITDDTLIDELNTFMESTKIIKDAPVVTSLAKNNISAVISKDDEIIRKFMRSIILQLITFHSYEDLKLVFLLNENKSKEWKYVKMLPHVWNNTRQIRFFADNYDQMSEISKYLEDELKIRTQKTDKSYKDFSPYYLIITDDYQKAEQLGFLTNFLKQEKNLGFSLLCISDDLFKVANQCKTFFNIENIEEGILIYNEIDSKIQTEIKMEQLNPIFFEQIAQKLANIPIRIETQAVTALPDSYTFLEMYDVGNINQLEILKRWQRNDPTKSLKAPIGVDGNGKIISLDAHEKYHGPHGLIAGTTGSGKSEFIITYILSLAINYQPEDVAFLLIDYKGGGLAGAFQKENMELPHLVGTITNIDKSELQRSLVSIQSELKRRQVMFNEARNKTNGGTIDIYKYQKLYHEGIVKKPIPHLFIICDEFAELKQQQEDFMDELMSVSRIGRSLGVHLILATQKPSGIVNDQILSNSKFAVCLKVQDQIDSSDVLLRPDAAYLKSAGQFYLKVGQNEYFVLGQSGWAGAQYIPSDTMKKQIDNSIEIIDNTGSVIKKIDNLKQQSNTPEGEQLTAILKTIYDCAKEQKIETKNLWLESIPEDIYVKDIREKYNVEKKENEIEVLIGEYDDPANQKQGPAIVNLSQKDNVIIYGNAKSGKETLISTMIYDLMVNYTVEQAQIYILDFGAEALKIFKESPHVGEVIVTGEDEAIKDFFEMMTDEINTRKEILSSYNGDYNLYIQKGNKMPLQMIVINNYETFFETYDEYDDTLLVLAREGIKVGMVFVVTAASTGSMRYRMSQNFNKKIALQLNDDDEFLAVFESVGRKRPAHIFGRGLIKIGEEDILEFQTAKICKAIDYNDHLEETIKELKAKNPVKAKGLPKLPEELTLEDLRSELEDISSVPVGIEKKSLKIAKYDFLERFMTMISANNIEDVSNYTYNICKLIAEIENVDIKILDAQNSKGDLSKQYKDFVSEIKKGIKNNDNITLCAIIGIDNLTEEEAFDETDFTKLLGKAKKSEKYCFIIADDIDNYQNHEVDEWYENYNNENTCIWIGEGIEDQSMIYLKYDSDEIDNKCGNNFGYLVESGEPTLIKIIKSKEGDEDE